MVWTLTELRLYCAYSSRWMSTLLPCLLALWLDFHISQLVYCVYASPYLMVDGVYLRHGQMVEVYLAQA